MTKKVDFVDPDLSLAEASKLMRKDNVGCLLVAENDRIVVMTISGIGVLKNLTSGRNVSCACLGTLLNVPLSTVSVVENFAMGLMAAYNLLIH